MRGTQASVIHQIVDRRRTRTAREAHAGPRSPPSTRAPARRTNASAGTLTAKPLELAQREHDGHGLAASGEFDLLAGFGQIDDAWGDPECAWLESFWRALRGRTASHLVAES
jgi:hypothetical protein